MQRRAIGGEPMDEVICPVCSVAQEPSDDCIACGHPLGVEDAAVEPDEAEVEGFDEDDLDDIAVEADDGSGD